MSRAWSPRSPRMTTRRAMAAILVVASGLGFGLPAVETCRERDWHVHGFINPSPDSFWSTYTRVPLPYWPRYWRRLAGSDLHARDFCGIDEGRPGESCEFEYPMMIVSDSGGSDPTLEFQQTPKMRSESIKYFK